MSRQTRRMRAELKKNMWGCHFPGGLVQAPLLESQAEEHRSELTPIIPGRDDLIDVFQPSCLLPPNKMTCASKQLLSGMSTVIKRKVHAHFSLLRWGGEASSCTTGCLAEAVRGPSLKVLAHRLGCPVVASESTSSATSRR